MLTELIKYPETLAHWIVLLPFLSFVFITLKLTINRNVERKPKKEKPKLTPEEEELKKLMVPAWKYYIWPVLAVIAFVIFLFIKNKVGEQTLSLIHI